METKEPFKMSPKVLSVVLLTMVALIPPLTIISLGVAKYLKDRKAVVAATMNEPAKPDEGLTKMVEAATDRQFKDLAGKPPSVRLVGAKLSELRPQLEQIAEANEGVFMTSGSNQGLILLKQKSVDPTMNAIRDHFKIPKLQIIITTEASKAAPEEAVGIDIFFEETPAGTASPK